MHPVIGRCPVCSNPLAVVRLRCESCQTEISGNFALGKFQQLKPEQLQFIETFIKCEGKIKDVEEEMGISYPTVRARLRDVIRALGYEPADDAPHPESTRADRRRAILNDLHEKRISVDDAARLLKQR